MRRDEHPPSFPDDLRRLEQQRQQAERDAEIAARLAVPTTPARPNSRGGYCSDPKCKVWHPPDVDPDSERQIAA